MLLAPRRRADIPGSGETFAEAAAAPGFNSSERRGGKGGISATRAAGVAGTAGTDRTRLADAIGSGFETGSFETVAARRASAAEAERARERRSTRTAPKGFATATFATAFGALATTGACAAWGALNGILGSAQAQASRLNASALAPGTVLGKRVKDKER